MYLNIFFIIYTYLQPDYALFGEAWAKDTPWLTKRDLLSSYPGLTLHMGITFAIFIYSFYSQIIRSLFVVKPLSIFKHKLFERFLYKTS